MRYVLWGVLAMVGCSHVPKDAHGNVACPVLKPLNRDPQCTEKAGEVDCLIGDIPPDSWGLCAEESSKEFTCLKDGLISRYSTGPYAKWSMPAEACPALETQLKLFGTDKVVIPGPRIHVEEVPSENKKI